MNAAQVAVYLAVPASKVAVLSSCSRDWAACRAIVRASSASNAATLSGDDGEPEGASSAVALAAALATAACTGVLTDRLPNGCAGGNRKWGSMFQNVRP